MSNACDHLNREVTDEGPSVDMEGAIAFGELMAEYTDDDLIWEQDTPEVSGFYLWVEEAPEFNLSKCKIYALVLDTDEYQQAVIDDDNKCKEDLKAQGKDPNGHRFTDDFRRVGHQIQHVLDHVGGDLETEDIPTHGFWASTSWADVMNYLDTEGCEE